MRPRARRPCRLPLRCRDPTPHGPATGVSGRAAPPPIAVACVRQIARGRRHDSRAPPSALPPPFETVKNRLPIPSVDPLTSVTTHTIVCVPLASVVVLRIRNPIAPRVLLKPGKRLAMSWPEMVVVGRAYRRAIDEDADRRSVERDCFRERRQRPAEVDVGLLPPRHRPARAYRSHRTAWWRRRSRTSSSRVPSMKGCPSRSSAHVKNWYVPLPWLGSMFVSTMKPQPALVFSGYVGIRAGNIRPRPIDENRETDENLRRATAIRIHRRHLRAEGGAAHRYLRDLDVVERPAGERDGSRHACPKVSWRVDAPEGARRRTRAP